MKRRSSEEVLAEFHRLSDVFEPIVECWSANWEFEPGMPTRDELLSSIPKRETLVAKLERGDATAGELLAMVQTGLDDLSTTFAMGWAAREATASAVLDCYRAKTGRGFFEDAGHPDRLARSILRRGHIEDEAQYRLLMELVSAGGANLLTRAQTAKAKRLMAAFEDTAHEDGA